MPRIEKRRYGFFPARKIQLGEHDGCTLGEKTLLFLCLKQQVGCARIELILCMLAMQGIKAMPDSGRVNDKHLAKRTSVSGCLGKELAFDVIHNNAVFPGEQLAGC